MKKGTEKGLDLVAMVEVLTKQLEGKDELNAALMCHISELEQTIKSMEQTISKLNDEISTLQRNLFGTKSEKSMRGKGSDKDDKKGDDGNGPTGNGTCVSTEDSTQKQKGYKHPERRNYDDIEPTKVTHIKPPAEDIKGARLVKKLITYKFTYVPAHIEKEQIIRYVYSKDGHLITPPLPYVPEEFEKRHLDASLAAGILTNKYHLHVPLERQLTMLNNGPIQIAKSTFFGYAKASIDAVDGIYQAIRSKVLSDNRMHIDETVQRLVDPDKHKCRNGYDWGFVSPKYRLMYFTSTDGSRGSDVLDKELEEYQGKYIQTDGYGAYLNAGERLGRDLIQVPCLSHVKRKFVDSLPYHQTASQEAIDQVDIMFSLEKDLREQRLTGSQIAAIRRSKLKPMLDKFKAWLIRMRESKGFFSEDNFGKAVNYAYDRIDKFYILLKDGLLKIENNLAERVMRGHTLGRKNYLFCQNIESEVRTCKIYSVIESCKLSGIDPFRYLYYVFSHPPKPGEQWSDLLPGCIKHRI